MRNSTETGSSFIDEFEGTSSGPHSPEPSCSNSLPPLSLDPDTNISQSLPSPSWSGYQSDEVSNVDGDVIRRPSTCFRGPQRSLLIGRRSKNRDRNSNKIRPQLTNWADDGGSKDFTTLKNDVHSNNIPKGDRRFLMKDGSSNVRKSNISSRGQMFLIDMYTTLVDMEWMKTIALFVCALVGSWIIFALIWWLIAVREPVPSFLLLSTSDDEKLDQTESCIGSVHDFHTALLFSIETQHTIGYGTRLIAYACPAATATLIIQSCVGILLSSLLAGITYTKLARPVLRSQTVIFSRRAVICRRDGEHCLLFRVGDIRRSHIVNSSIRALLVRWRQSPSGSSLQHRQLTLDTEAGNGVLFLVWPVTVVHKITSNSPLWDLSADRLSADSDRLEIIVILQGVVEVSGKMIEIRTSYRSPEIVWGARLKPLFTSHHENDKNKPIEIDFGEFDKIVETPMTRASARDYSKRRQYRRSQTNSHESTAGDCTQQDWRASDVIDDIFIAHACSEDEDENEQIYSSTFAPISPTDVESKSPFNRRFQLWPSSIFKKRHSSCDEGRGIAHA